MPKLVSRSPGRMAAGGPRAPRERPLGGKRSSASPPDPWHGPVAQGGARRRDLARPHHSGALACAHGRAKANVQGRRTPSGRNGVSDRTRRTLRRQRRRKEVSPIPPRQARVAYRTHARALARRLAAPSPADAENRPGRPRQWPPRPGLVPRHYQGAGRKPVRPFRLLPLGIASRGCDAADGSGQPPPPPAALRRRRAQDRRHLGLSLAALRPRRRPLAGAEVDMAEENAGQDEEARRRASVAERWPRRLHRRAASGGACRAEASRSCPRAGADTAPVHRRPYPGANSTRHANYCGGADPRRESLPGSRSAASSAPTLARSRSRLTKRRKAPRISAAYPTLLLRRSPSTSSPIDRWSPLQLRPGSSSRTMALPFPATTCRARSATTARASSADGRPRTRSAILSAPSSWARPLRKQASRERC